MYNIDYFALKGLRMDTTLAKTFLTIVEVGNFRLASERLHVTQSTVSSRIRTLEDQLGKTLFIRNKSGATLTQAGVYFQEYALSFIQLWERAIKKVSSEDIYSEYVTVGARPGLWEPIVMDWLPWAKSQYQNIAYRVEFGIARELVRKLEEGIIDIAILLSAPSIPGIIVEELYLEKFVLVANLNTPQKDSTFNEIFYSNYIEVDWGKEFKESMKHYFPTPIVPQLSVNIGLYGIKYIMAFGGCGYFPLSIVSEYLDDGSLTIVEKAPVIKQSAYLAFNKEDSRDYLEILLAGFRKIGKKI